MLKRIIVLTLAVLPLLVSGQVTVNAQLPPAGLIQRDQLWNLVLVNNGSASADVIISVNLQDVATGQTVLSGSSRTFSLGKGMKMVALSDVQPVHYNYLTAEFTSTYIPLGSYIACYRILENKGEGTLPMADECIRVNISPLSPPLLNTPIDKTVLNETYPQFNWIPPAPAEMFGNLNYELVVTDVLPGQSPSEAIFNNSPVYTNANLRLPFERYPGSYPALRKDKLYAWQVTAKNGLNYSTQTDVWTFTIGQPDTTSATTASAVYLPLISDGYNGVNVIRGNDLYIRYYSYFEEHEANAKIISWNGKVVQEIRQKINYGDNFLVFQLNASIDESKIYTLEIVDPQRIKHRVRFSIKQSKQN